MFFFFLFMMLIFIYFFFQAEDGIRDIGVTGVQTCALPIYLFISGEVWASQAWLVVVEPIRKAGIDLGWAFVKEGSIGWFEGLTMVKGTKHEELLHKLANYTIGDLYPYMVYKDTGYYPTSLAPKKRMTKAEVADSRLNKPKLPNAQHYYATPPNFAKWQEVWNEVKAA